MQSAPSYWEVRVAIRIDVDQRSGIPIYLQIVEQVRHGVEVGSLRAGERLPTVRQLAEEVSVAPNTVVKAYGELRRMGLLESRPGVGTVVVEGSGEEQRERQLAALDERLRALVRDAVGLGLDEDAIWERFDAEFERLRG
ncbi:GntR family transcriptional regulator [Rubrobacter aplysinae]|uniref:GntR family transcriptional regulator n=1 Tax=Rubrobacter aplysinae TaxID=909625 RepID=UPI00064BF020|nr:GntR family transcriptional regulator [Rubrobacter aplysinae]